MNYPVFFDEIETIKVKDELSNALGAFEKGEYEFSYLDVVKSAGHSCPTVAGAYIITLEALKALYPDQRALRGDIKVEFEESLEEGVAGVIANVISQITGATDTSGFKGLQGRFARHSLMHFNRPIKSSARFTRVSKGKSVDVTYNPSSVLPNPKMQELMQKMAQSAATPEELKEFGILWQERVQRIFENIQNVVAIAEV
ncbi:hypothetical protein KJ877_05615 [bacterium]|nr:hypothetical protein [bacterium]MBU1990510.1 hypothetical protein [bacterium]